MSREITRSSPVPLYRQIQRLIIQLIELGELVPDSMLSEQELARRFEVSRITTRQALGELEREGWVIRVQGKGTFVTERRKLEPLSALTSFSENMRALGMRPSYRTLGITVIPASAEVAGGLEVAVEEDVLRIERLLYADDIEMALMRAFLPRRIYELDSRPWTPERLDRTSMYRILEEDLGVSLWKAQETVEAVRADAEAEFMSIGRDDLILSVRRRTWDRESRPVEYTNLLYRADLYRYRVELFRSPSPGSEHRGSSTAAQDIPTPKEASA